jgi:hypothetical protein
MERNFKIFFKECRLHRSAYMVHGLVFRQLTHTACDYIALLKPLTYLLKQQK